MNAEQSETARGLLVSYVSIDEIPVFTNEEVDGILANCRTPEEVAELTEGVGASQQDQHFQSFLDQVRPGGHRHLAIAIMRYDQLGDYESLGGALKALEDIRTKGDAFQEGQRKLAEISKVRPG